ncbi:Chimeric ERCC6-PGBD3 protein [Eumeta japonica]|uniref:Chimeric ERCC6-PGBD3 protein n=1 Tax=Eumeta variegata TaxID=151549 RepID=A0A4C1VC93_EUMVA|nr:Chimeric ERCC6-PGBD3 protein [Eumeta japonica]
MSCNRFEEIKRFIHFNDNLTQIPKGQLGYNPLHKIQPLLELLRQRILTVPKEQYMAVDEQIIPTKSRSSMRQYNPKKPHKWGYKTLSLAAAKVPVEKDFKKGRGTTVEKLTTIDNTDISVVTWYDNRVVNLASTYVGSKPSSEVRRFKKRKAYQNVSCPKAVTVYNRHMGGVDLLDALLGYYRIQIRSKKFYHRIFFHMIDMMTVNAWLLYRRTLADSDPYLPLADFKCAVAEGLSQSNKPSTSGKRGRPSYELENAIEAKKLRGPIAIMPSRDVRLDQIDHMPLDH